MFLILARDLVDGSVHIMDRMEDQEKAQIKADLLKDTQDYTDAWVEEELEN